MILYMLGKTELTMRKLESSLRLSSLETTSDLSFLSLRSPLFL